MELSGYSFLKISNKNGPPQTHPDPKILIFPGFPQLSIGNQGRRIRLAIGHALRSKRGGGSPSNILRSWVDPGALGRLRRKKIRMAEQMLIFDRKSVKIRTNPDFGSRWVCWAILKL